VSTLICSLLHLREEKKTKYEIEVFSPKAKKACEIKKRFDKTTKGCKE
jgi:hypothetical protein